MAVSSQGSKEATLEQIRKDYPRRWVAIIVTKRDENGQPLAGEVVAEDADRYRLRDAIVKQNDICIFFAGDSAYPLFL
ncbi:MAG: hypothetical protein JRM80_05630 [Nitrososphaerota archaeon]|nr:hypothetical protein [Nitrososphaerota archaeon]